MKKLFLLAAFSLAATAALASPSSDLVFVKGGAFKDTRSNYYAKGVTVSDFYIAKYDVTQKEWTSVMGSNPSRFKGDDQPVESVSWYDAIDYCNQRSLKEGLTPFYSIDKTHADPNNLPDPKFGDLDTIKWTVTINPRANGYRLPTEAEWEYAASGGQLTHSYTYSGSNNIEDVAWYWRNAGDTPLTGYWRWPDLQANHDRPHSVAAKKPNELGLYDMSGNVREWCWDWFGDIPQNAANPTGASSGHGRVWKGGGWIGAEFCCEPAFRAALAANGTGPDQGFRICRNG